MKNFWLDDLPVPTAHSDPRMSLTLKDFPDLNPERKTCPIEGLMQHGKKVNSRELDEWLEVFPV